MGRLADEIRELVAAETFAVSEHAREQLAARGVLEWQTVDGLANGDVLSERPYTSPNPSIEVRQVLADGTPIKAVWSLIRSPRLAYLVTVHFFDR